MPVFWPLNAVRLITDVGIRASLRHRGRNDTRLIIIVLGPLSSQSLETRKPVNNQFNASYNVVYTVLARLWLYSVLTRLWLYTGPGLFVRVPALALLLHHHSMSDG